MKFLSIAFVLLTSTAFADGQPAVCSASAKEALHQLAIQEKAASMNASINEAGANDLQKVASRAKHIAELSTTIAGVATVGTGAAIGAAGLGGGALLSNGVLMTAIGLSDVPGALEAWAVVSIVPGVVSGVLTDLYVGKKIDQIDSIDVTDDLNKLGTNAQQHAAITKAVDELENKLNSGLDTFENSVSFGWMDYARIKKIVDLDKEQARLYREDVQTENSLASIISIASSCSQE